MRALLLLPALFATAAAPAFAAVKTTAPDGFEVVETIEVKATPAKAYAGIVDVAGWWSSAHTFSRSAKNLRIDAKPGGCFCEALKGGGGVQHMMVVFVAPDAMLRMRGALGPLGGEGVDGAMTIAIKPNGSGATVTIAYVVGGWLRPKGGDGWAPMVDAMLSEQATRLGRFIDTGSPEPAK